MNWADLAILTIIGISVLISVFRGFVREALSLIGLVVSIWVAVAFYNPAADLLVNVISVPTGRRVLAFIGIVLVALLVTGTTNHFIGRLIEKSGLTTTDRMLGVVFGAVRGVAIIGVLVLLLGLTQVPGDPWWSESNLMKYFEKLAHVALNLMPPDIQVHFSYS
jgi:membrane protein required for colicin V production